MSLSPEANPTIFYRCVIHLQSHLPTLVSLRFQCQSRPISITDRCHFIAQTMPPTPAKSITQYFNKVPTPSKPPAAPPNGLPSSPPAPSVGSSPVAGVKRSFLSDAAKRAIQEGAAEGSETKKKAKLDTSEGLSDLLRLSCCTNEISWTSESSLHIQPLRLVSPVSLMPDTEVIQRVPQSKYRDCRNLAPE
jgi:hypothetical protein